MTSAHTDAPYLTTGEVLPVDTGSFFTDFGGLPLSMTYLMAFFQAADGSAQWMPMRGLYSQATRSFHPVEMAPGSDFVAPDDASNAYTGKIEIVEQAGAWGFVRDDGQALFTATDTACSWNEDEFLQIEGVAVPGAAYRMRVHNDEDPFGYTSRAFLARGTVRGKEVTGAVIQGALHMAEGRTWVPGPYLRRLQVAWVEFINEMADGSVETGLLLAGREGFRAMIVQRDGVQVVATADFSVEVDSDDAPDFPRRIRYSWDGGSYVWEALPEGGRWPIRHDLPGVHRLRQGTVRREGSSEQVARSQAMLEAYQDRLSEDAG